LMNAAARKYGLLTVQQSMCATLEEALEFAAELGITDEIGVNGDGKRCVLKPVRGVASDSVFLCQSLSEVKDAYEQIRGKAVYGSPTEKHEQVLVQEFAIGTEYAVDIVSKAGEHKVAALWKYDKRPVNGAPFVYHGTMLADASTEEGKAACEYAMSALDAVDVKWGLSHVEVMVDLDGGSRLIEVNCRQHNTDFAPMTSACIGYNALDMLLAAYLGDIEDLPVETAEQRLDWSLLPRVPVPRAYGSVIHLVCHAEGKVVDIKGIEELENLESVRAMDIYPSFFVGNEVRKTIDIRSDAGWVHVVHDDEERFSADYDKVVSLMKDMFVVDKE